MEFMPYEDCRQVPNIVVDGSPNPATVLTLTHWPRIVQPAGVAHDLSAGMAFRYLDAPPPHDPAEAVTNNHFDQDGLVSMFALLHPDEAQEHRELLIDLAAAGDFATYRDRRAARASMTISRLAEYDPSDDADYADICAERYTKALPLVLPMLLDGERFRDHWGDEDAELERSEKAIADGTIKITEDPGLDLAVATAPEHWVRAKGHRFGGEEYEGAHPMALHNATACVRLLFTQGRRYRYTDRYETWVQYISRPLPARRDLRPLAEDLNSLESGPAHWSADKPGALAPLLDHTGESSLDHDTVLTTICRHLRTAPPAWSVS